jgi:DNA-binding PadR family transcriptional regulator
LQAEHYTSVTPCAVVLYHVAVRHVVHKSEQDGLSETVFLILSSLAAEPRHGYAILQDVELMTAGRVRLSTGTLYGALRRLLDARSIRRFEEPNPSRDRQAYELTARGREVLAAEVARMRHLSGVAAGRLAEGV